ncbi:NfeD family protein [Solihabitans fulvus]|uniref:NfeD family protein n=1 Tax=Solihabitans fulvus TaxID=1892852 RepID=A0A5B2XRX0_9PSEU|nr:NfeD family protein [Solihabitans fulvus]KAA2265710.1 NfeD family protein [Solihabitans fulvus]
MAAVVWLVLGVVLVAAEVLSGSFVLLMLGAAALAAAVGALVSLPLSAVVFALGALGLITFARPPLLRRLHAVEPMKSNIEALVGGRAVVVSTVDVHGGQVRIAGDLWSARAFDETQVLEPGSSVMVMTISGATAVVWSDR